VGAPRVGALVSSVVFLLVAGCLPEVREGVERQEQPIVGSNQSGANLGGNNLGGNNLGGNNLGGANLGGNNLGGNNLGGNNLGGTNLGGNNLGGNNLAGTNLGGNNLGGNNLGGNNLGGKNLAGSNLGGSNVAGTNLGGNNLGATNLAAANLSGATTASNIHNLSGAVTGMLYSGEDLWLPKSGQCIVMGIGSTAFPKLLGQQSSTARISVALGKLPWGFAASAGGPIALQAWEAVVWGDRTYCVFVMAAPPATTWPGVAGFIKAVFRWNAPVTQSMDITGIDASAAIDPTVSTAVTTYTGMMNAAAKQRAALVTDTVFIAGELAFASATTNNQSVLVDFSSWVLDSKKNALVLGNVEPTGSPTYAEALYIALDNGDGTVSIIIDDAASRTAVMPAGMTNSVVDLYTAYRAWQTGLGPKPVPRRCNGALFLKTWFGEPVPAGKCDDGLVWAPGFCIRGADPWSAVSGTTAPMNGYMQLTQTGGPYKRALLEDNSCGTMRPVLSETYVHMWEKSYDLPVPASCVPESNASFCGRLAKDCGSVSGTDNCGAARTVSSCGSCVAPESCGGDGEPNVCGNSALRSFEAEALGNTVTGETFTSTCPQAYNKLGATGISTQGACSGGGKVKYVGNGSGNYFVINNVNVPAAGTYPLMIYGWSQDTRTFSLSVNGGTARSLSMAGPNWSTTVGVATRVALAAGNNSLKLYNSTAYAPDFDRVVVTTGACVPESDATFCARQAKSCGGFTSVDNCGNTRSAASCGSCPSPYTCGGGGTPNICGKSFEAESYSNTLAGTAATASCSGCSGGYKVKNLGNGSANYITFNNISVPVAGSYLVTFHGYSGDGWRTYNMSVNGGASTMVKMNGSDWSTQVITGATVTLKAGTNTIKLSNSTNYGPDLDRITLSGGP
jgi:hypothetical protein